MMWKQYIALPFLLLVITACDSDFKMKIFTDSESSSSPPNSPPQEDEPETNRSIEDDYPFLKDADFWRRVSETKPIPSTKRCSNTFSYAYLGVARLVSQYIYGDFPLLPFHTSGPRYVPYFNGYPRDVSRTELFGPESLLRQIYIRHQDLTNELQLPLTLTSLTKSSEFDHDNHCRHRGGTAIDIRPLPGDKPTNWRNSNYNFELNLKFVKQLLTYKEVQVIFFNDPNIYSDPEVQKLLDIREQKNWVTVYRTNISGHDNHLHVEFELDPQVHLVTEHIMNSTDIGPKALQSLFFEGELESH